MKNLIVATRNKGKMKEFSEILSGLPFRLLSMEEAGIDIDIAENGKTFEENALIKAMEIHKLTGEMVIADDSGLEVDCLNGAPGIYSARFAGENATDEDRNNKLLAMMKDVPYEKRTARFVAAIAVVFEDGSNIIAKGTCEGLIGFKPEGKNGFGYDPLFFVPEYGMTVAQMEPELKNRISHRAKALGIMAEKLKSRLE